MKQEKSAEPVIPQPDRSSGSRMLWLLAAASAVVFLGLHAWNLNDRFLAFKWDGVALGRFSHLLWSLANGTVPTEPSGGPVDWFKIPAVFYVLAPVYRWWPSPLLLPVVQTAALAAATATVFLLACRYVRRTKALVLTLFFCFYPPVYAMSSASFHPAMLAVPFLAAMILSAVRGRAPFTILFAVLALACDLRAGLLTLPIFVWLAGSSGNRSWLWSAPIAAAAVAAGWRIGPEEGMGPLIFFGALLAPYLFWGLSALAHWTDRVLKKRSIALALLSPVFFAGAVCASVIMTPVYMDSHPGVSQLPVRKSAVQSLLDRVPADAEVLTTPLFLPRFSNRSGVALLTDAAGQDKESAKNSGTAPRYAIADLGGAGNHLDQAQEAASALSGLMEQGWGPVKSLGGVVLFSETPGAARETLYRSVDLNADRPYLVLRAKAGDAVELTGFTMDPDASDPDVIRFSFYWRKLEKSSDVYAARLSVVDQDGKAVYSVSRLLCYGLYPFAQWKRGECVKDLFSFVVPERLQNSSYEVRLSLETLPDTRAIPMTSPVNGALDAQGRVRLIALDAI